MAEIRYSNNTYIADRCPTGIKVCAVFRFHVHRVIVPDIDTARRWLGDHGLRRGKIKKLLSSLDGSNNRQSAIANLQ
jgi:hypothetical protein